MGLLPSQMVALLDELGERNLVDRQRNPEDRRHSGLILTKKGLRLLEKLAQIAREHEDEICAALTKKERATLARLCRTIASQQGLLPGVHPGYRKL